MTALAINIAGAVIAVVCIALAVPVMRSAQMARTEQKNRELARARAAGGGRITEEEVKKADRGRVGKRLDAAGLGVTTTFFLVSVLLAAVVCALLGFALGGRVGAVIGGFAACVIVQFWVHSRSVKRSGLFEAQLGECLPMVAEGIRGGMTFERAAQNVAAFMENPIREQFNMFAQERSFGTPIEVAMENMAGRVKSRDMDMLAAVVAVQVETGGSMADILDSLAETIQRRTKLRKHVAAVTADGRLSAIIIAAIPIVIFAALWFVAPDYASVLTGSTTGILLLLISAAMIVLGLVIIRALYNIKIY